MIQSKYNNHESVRVGLGKRSYDIVIHPGGIKNLGGYLRKLGYSGKVGILTNPIIQKLYGRTVERSLKQSGFQSLTVSYTHLTLRTILLV